jgi:hypothetical protein
VSAADPGSVRSRGDRLRATTWPADDLVQDDGVLNGCDVPDWLRRALGLCAE